ncbi:hypothetical protein CEE44_03655 [Candidatus Woesearchaeota archaeon B3_Woes]|nr:MAG: hypothetical protein CEE44_03655 [Candidatus Woesearchaeota archaeon B3_Woes]
MRRHEHKREKKKRLYMSLFIVMIMTLSVLGYMIGSGYEDQTKFEYNDFKFNQITNRWKTKINNYDVIFDYSPLQVEHINITPNIIERIKNSPQIDTTSNINSSFKEAIALAQYNLAQLLALNNNFLRGGFTTENEFNTSIITCEGATQYIPVLLFEKSNQTKIYEENNCIIIKARSEQDVIALKDRLAYGVFGII